MLVDLFSGKQKRKKLFETDNLSAAPTNDDGVKMHIQKIIVPKIHLGLCPV